MHSAPCVGCSTKGKEWKLLWNIPEFKLFKEEGRSLRLDEEAERKVVPVAEQPLKDIVILMRYGDEKRA